MRRLAPLALGAALCAAAVAAALAGGGRGAETAAEPARVAPGPESDAGSAGATRGEDLLGTQGASGRRRAAGSGAPEDAVLVRVALEGGAPAGERARVRVVTGALARVSWDRSRARLRERAERFEAIPVDADGVARIAAREDAYRVVAETSAHWGSRAVEPHEREIEVEALRCPPLLVRVIDAGGAPVAGVPLRLTASGPPLARPVRLTERLVRTRTDASGLLRVDDPLDGIRRGWTLRDLERAPGIRARIQVDAPIGPVEVVAPLRDALAAPVEVRLPPSGRLEVRVETPEGTPFEARRGVLTARTAARPGGDPARPAPGAGERWTVAFEGSTAVLPAVGLGLSFELRVEADGVPSGEAVLADGPTAAGETAVARIVPHGSMRVVVARLLRADGRPLGATRVHARLQAVEGGAWLAVSEVPVDRDGRIALWIPDRWSPRGPWTIDLAPEKAPGLAARVELLGELPHGYVDAGDVRLEEPPRIVAGTVRDAAGEPVGGTRIFVVPAAPEPGALGRPLDLVPVRSSSDGAFDVRARLDHPGPFDVFAEGDRHLSIAPARVERGASDVGIVVQERGALCATLLVPEAAQAKDLEVAVERGPAPRGPGLEAPPRRLDLRSNLAASAGTTRLQFALRNAVPGAYDLAVTFRGEALVRLAGVRVASGGESRDPRLDPLDLRGLLSVTTVAVRDEQGRPIEECRFRWRPTGSDRWSRTEVSPDHVARIVSARIPVDVELLAPDHDARLLLGIAGEHEAVLR